jgi:hypothetical protein
MMSRRDPSRAVRFGHRFESLATLIPRGLF